MNDLISRQAAIDALHCDITVTGRQNAELVAATAVKVYGLTKDAEINRAILKAAELKVAITKAQERRKK